MKRTKEEYMSEYDRWLTSANDDADLKPELEVMDDASIEDAFYKDLSFGTGGLRGTIGAGTNRMNIYTVKRASQGLCNYLLSYTHSINSTHSAHPVSNENITGCTPSVVIARDSRIKSLEFSRTAAGVFAANGIKVYYFDDIAPTPLLSFAVRELHATAGIVITASHNPKQYNGYKVYGDDGCQITTEAAKSIQGCIQQVDTFDTLSSSFEDGLSSGQIEYVEQNIIDSYLEAVRSQSVLYGDTIDKSASIVYTPLNGTGLSYVRRVLSDSGYTNITVVESQSSPDGTFPTCSKPNPEERSAMEEGLKKCRETGADLLIATDPDADRCGIAVKDSSDYRLLTANETGILLLDYICSQRVKHHTLPERGIFMKTIVTNDLAEKIAASYGLITINTLTGFKFIGEQISRLESSGRTSDFIFGFEESYGYLTGSYARDKDGVLAAYLIAEMYSFYATKGLSLLQKLNEVYSRFGYCLNTQHSYEFQGAVGMEQMNSIMASFRATPLALLANQKVTSFEDYNTGIGNLPKSNVLKFYTQYSSVVIRPSGTEPKLKVYISARATNEENAHKVEKAIAEQIDERIKGED